MNVKSTRRPQTRFYRKYHDGFAVLCKCPRCEILHIKMFQSPPLVMPRLYCEEHKGLKYDSEEGNGYMKFKKAGRPTHE